MEDIDERCPECSEMFKTYAMHAICQKCGYVENHAEQEIVTLKAHLSKRDERIAKLREERVKAEEEILCLKTDLDLANDIIKDLRDDLNVQRRVIQIQGATYDGCKKILEWLAEGDEKDKRIEKLEVERNHYKKRMVDIACAEDQRYEDTKAIVGRQEVELDIQRERIKRLKEALENIARGPLQEPEGFGKYATTQARMVLAGKVNYERTGTPNGYDVVHNKPVYEEPESERGGER